MITLSGLRVVAVGFALRCHTVRVMMAAGFATGQVAGLSLHEIIGRVGNSSSKTAPRCCPWYRWPG
jgi:uncharacterized membrane protein